MLTAPPQGEEDGARGMGGQTALATIALWGQTLLKASPAGTLLFQRSRLSHLLLCLPFGIPGAQATDQEKGYPRPEGQPGRENLGRIQKV